MVLEQLLKAIRKTCPTDKAVLVSNYTEALDVLAEVSPLMTSPENDVAVLLMLLMTVLNRQGRI